MHYMQIKMYNMQEELEFPLAKKLQKIIIFI